MDSIISTTELRKSFRSKHGAIEAVRGVSIEVGRGEIFGFLGPNGAGKTTTLRMLTTLLPIDGGSATVAGIDVARHPPAGADAHRLRQPARWRGRSRDGTRRTSSSRAVSMAAILRR